MTRHRLDALSFVSGLLFAAVAVAGMTGPWRLRLLDPAWIAPGLLVLVGLVVLLTSISSRSRDEDERDAATDEPDRALGEHDPAPGERDAVDEDDPAAAESEVDGS